MDTLDSLATEFLVGGKDERVDFRLTKKLLDLFLAGAQKKYGPLAQQKKSEALTYFLARGVLCFEETHLSPRGTIRRKGRGKLEEVPQPKDAASRGA